MKYICTSCSYVFDNSVGDKEEWVEVWSELDCCPVCEEFDCFQWIDEEKNYISWEDWLSSIEIDHFPEINILSDKLEVIVWSEVHPMWENHRISSISLYDEYWDLIETKYLEIEQEPKVVFAFDDLDEFEVVVRCTQHWLWAKKYVN